MTITESQRRTLDLMAESAGWGWADVEALAQELCGEVVAGLTHRQAEILMGELEWSKNDAERAVMHDCDREYRADCARCNGVSPMDAGCW